jgi:hypothetical protein
MEFSYFIRSWICLIKLGKIESGVDINSDFTVTIEKVDLIGKCKDDSLSLLENDTFLKEGNLFYD